MWCHLFKVSLGHSWCSHLSCWSLVLTLLFTTGLIIITAHHPLVKAPDAKRDLILGTPPDKSKTETALWLERSH